MIPKRALCGCLTDVPAVELRGLLHHPEVDLLEWRLDVFFGHHGLDGTLEALSALSAIPRHPVVVTNRPKREGGAFEGTEALRLEILYQATQAGAEWVDLEDRLGRATIEGFQARNNKVLLSHHDFTSTPDRLTLQLLLEAMSGKKPDAIKIATYARTPEDSLKVLELIPFGREAFGIDVLAFGMGPLGRWSRLVCLLLGSPWTYVQLPEFSPAAEGQFNAKELRLLLKKLTPFDQQ